MMTRISTVAALAGLAFVLPSAQAAVQDLSPRTAPTRDAAAAAEAPAKEKVRTTRPATTAAEKAGTQVAARAAARAEQSRVAPEPARRGYREYVSLGDSWSADVVLLDTHGLPDSTHAPVDCAQSTVNYPKLVAKALGIAVHRDATCGSATTDHFANPQAGLPLGGTNPPQYDRLTPTTDLVTVGIGGNDAGVAAGAASCLSVLPVETVPMDLLPLPELPVPLVSTTTLPVGGCKAYFTQGGVDRLAVAITKSEIKLVRAFRRIHQLSPKARVLAVNYIAGIPKRGCWPSVPATDGDMAYLYSTFQKLNAMVARAAARGGAELVDAYTPTIGHDVCQAPNVRYVEMFGPSINDLAVGVPLHPNAAGARAQAAAVLAQVRKR